MLFRSKIEIAANPSYKGLVLTGGDDYEIIFCCNPEDSQKIISMGAEKGIAVTEIGRVKNRGDLSVSVTEGGRVMKIKDTSWRHF